MPNYREPFQDPHPRSFWAGFLSLLVPGLGQIYQGRIGKGLLFLVCLNGLFFYGMALGHWKNVYLPDSARGNNPMGLPVVAANLYNRLQYVGQFWIGVAAWPAVWQYMNFDERNERVTIFRDYQRTPSEEEVNQLQRNGDKTWDLGWVYTVIAGVLNILVIYDAFAGPAFAEGEMLHRAQQEAVPLMTFTSIYWHLPILIVVISLVYSATRYEHWDNIVREAFRWGLRMGAFLCGIGLVLYVLSLFI